MNKFILTFTVILINNIVFSQQDTYSVCVSFYKYSKIKKRYEINYKNNKETKKYKIIISYNDSIYKINANNYYKFCYNNKNSIMLSIVDNDNNEILKIDSLEFYFKECNTLNIFLGINKKAKYNSYVGDFYKNDFQSNENCFCKNCNEKEKNLVIIECSRYGFFYKKNRHCKIKLW